MENVIGLTQDRAPLLEALEKMKANRLVPFDVPGHKRGRGNRELAEFLGQNCLDVDVNSMKPLDNLCHPVSVIRDAEKLAAQAFGAANAFFMVGGTTSSVQAMILATVKPHEKIILPRNVHRSAINALILCGASPVYVNPQVDSRLGISLGMSVDDVKRAIEKNPDAKALLVNNPTYYGICSDIETLTKLAHDNGMKLLADEAHGTQFYFNKRLPKSAMSVGADMAAVSMHSLTQSSLLLTGENVNAGYVHQIINLTQSTSGSYLLMSSLDISRRNLALNGEKIFDGVIDLVEYARDEINFLGGWYAYGHELINGDSVFDFDTTKLSIFTRAVGEVYDILRDEYDIQLEFGDIANTLAYVSIGDRKSDIERLISALADIKRIYRKDPSRLLKTEYIEPIVDATPKEAFYSNKKSLPLNECVGETAAEFVMSYPPGIPILAPGEIKYAKKKGCQITGPEDMSIRRLQVING